MNVAGVAVALVLAAAEAAPAQREGGGRPSQSGVYKSRIVPHWFGEETRFWYRNDLPGGAEEPIRLCEHCPVVRANRRGRRVI